MKQIVVVEDFSSSRKIVVSTLTRSGYNVLEAEDGRDALKYFDGRKIDLLITDYNMPNMDGNELIQYVRNQAAYSFLPILVLSTETNLEKQREVTAHNITGWIKKPFQVEPFLKIVEKALRYDRVPRHISE